MRRSLDVCPQVWAHPPYRSLTQALRKAMPGNSALVYSASAFTCCDHAGAFPSQAHGDRPQVPTSPSSLRGQCGHFPYIQFFSGKKPNI